jgi:uncharacterized protein YggE
MKDYGYYGGDMHMGSNGLLTINGVGSVKVMGNLAVVSLGIVSENISLKAAQEENAARTNAVLNGLYGMGLLKNQISTKSYSIEPIYDYAEGKQIFQGYRVSNLLSINILNLMEIGKVIDNATSNGANRVDNVSFTLIDNSKYVDQALELAIKDATRKSVVIGNTLGVTVDETPIRIIEEGTANAFNENPSFKLAAATTPILPGQIDVTIRIVAVFHYN